MLIDNVLGLMMNKKICLSALPWEVCYQNDGRWVNLYPPNVSGICLVQWLTSRTCRDLLVIVCCGHGCSSGGSTTRYLGQLPPLPDAEWLPKNRWYVTSFQWTLHCILELRKHGTRDMSLKYIVNTHSILCTSLWETYGTIWWKYWFSSIDCSFCIMYGETQ